MHGSYCVKRVYLGGKGRYHLCKLLVSVYVYHEMYNIALCRSVCSRKWIWTGERAKTETTEMGMSSPGADLLQVIM